MAGCESVDIEELVSNEIVCRAQEEYLSILPFGTDLVNGMGPTMLLS